MSMKLHELHPAMIHAPLVLLPAAAAVDLVAATAKGPRGWWLSRFGARLWPLGAGAGLLAGLAGMAASQEVNPEDRKVSDAMYLHGIGNFGLVVAALGMAIFRARRRPTVGSATIGLAACGAALYTAYLGGELVYGSGLGVKAMTARSGVVPGVPDVLSREAPGRFLRDAVKGLGWLFRRTAQLISGEVPFERRALVHGKEAGRVEAERAVEAFQARRHEPLPIPPPTYR